MQATMATTLDRAAIERVPWEPFAGMAGVRHKVLWSDDEGNRAGYLELEPGARLAAHTHHHAVHHVWVAVGTCVIDGEVVTAGGYSYVPEGVSHGIDEAGPNGCELLYLFLKV